MPEQPFGARLKHAWNAFRSRDPTENLNSQQLGAVSYSRPDKPRRRRTNEQSIITAVYNRMAIDVASISIRHVRVNDNDQYEEDIDSSLNSCLTLEANLDQTGRALIQDIAMSIFDEGCVAVVPVETDTDPDESESYKILQLRVGKIVHWYPRHVMVSVYNEQTGFREDIRLEKNFVAIIENPLYAVMNEPNSTLQRLIRKLNILDSIDEQSGAGKLDIIIQLPYVIKTEARRQQAESRRKDIEMQLSGSKYGIAYTDGTERITQLNRAAENNLMSQIQYLTSMLYSQLGITEEVFLGTANEATMLNYMSRAIEPLLSAIVDELKRKFLTKTAITQGQSIMYFRSSFKLVPANDLANMADKYTRNEIMSSNEFRALIGLKPSKNPSADELRNKNINQAGSGLPGSNDPSSSITQTGLSSDQVLDLFDELLDSLDSDIDSILGDSEEGD